MKALVIFLVCVTLDSSVEELDNNIITKVIIRIIVRNAIGLVAVAPCMRMIHQVENK